jgi:predicted metal-dependent peptidase
MRSRFWGAIVLGLRWVEDPAIGTMATDGTNLILNPFWCEKIGIERTTATLAHEASHIVCKHHLRMAARPIRRWNVACDLAINPPLVRDNWKLPEDLLFDKRFDRWTAERIDAFLAAEEKSRAENQQNQGNSGSDQGNSTSGSQDNQQQNNAASATSQQRDSRAGPDQAEPGIGTSGRLQPASTWGEIRPAADENGKPLSPAGIRVAEAKLDRNIAQAARMARQAGQDGAWLEEIVHASQQRPDWEGRFAREFAGIAQARQAWSRPNRRHIQNGLWLPGRRKSGSGEVAFVVDTSGSIDAVTLAKIAGAAVGVVEETGPSRLVMIQCDSSVKDVQEFGPGDAPHDIVVRGRGGTRLQPAFDWIAANMDADAIVYATDLDSVDQPSDPGVAVTWLVIGSKTPGFGTVVRMD